MKSYFFNALKTSDTTTYQSGYDREYDADDHAAFFAPFFSEAGVFAGNNAGACKVQVQSGLTLAVAAGAVFVRGRMAVFDGTETITVTGNCKIVARMDKSLSVRAFQLLAVTALNRSEDIYDLELTSVAVSGGTATVTDTRTFLSYMGQPAYYPPTADDLPYVLWLYTLGFPMTEEQRAMVEGNPSLMSVFNASLGAARAMSVAFTADQWSDGTLTIVPSAHGRTSGRFGYTLQHSVGGQLMSDTLSALGTNVSYDSETGIIVLTCDDAYDGQITFFA